MLLRNLIVAWTMNLYHTSATHLSSARSNNDYETSHLSALVSTSSDHLNIAVITPNDEWLRITHYFGWNRDKKLSLIRWMCVQSLDQSKDTHLNAQRSWFPRLLNDCFSSSHGTSILAFQVLRAQSASQLGDPQGDTCRQKRIRGSSRRCFYHIEPRNARTIWEMVLVSGRLIAHVKGASPTKDGRKPERRNAIGSDRPVTTYPDASITVDYLVYVWPTKLMAETDTTQSYFKHRISTGFLF